MKIKPIYYLYAYVTHDLLLITRDKKEYEQVWDYYESNGIMCYGGDNESTINNIKIEQEEWERAQK